MSARMYKMAPLGIAIIAISHCQYYTLLGVVRDTLGCVHMFKNGTPWVLCCFSTLTLLL